MVRDEKILDVARGADLLLGMSVKGAFTREVLGAMAPGPMVFALANPGPEIDYNEARDARPDAIIATGRSDFPNQVNNGLGFPYIFRAALDVRATGITEEMKVAAVKALALLAREDVPDAVIRAYGGKPIRFGPGYIIPKPMDSRVLPKVVPAVAEVAVKSGVARINPPGLAAYIQRLEASLGPERELMRRIIVRAQQAPLRVVLPEGNHPVIIRAAHRVSQEGVARPLLLGQREEIEKLADRLQISLEGIEILNPLRNEYFDGFLEKLFAARQRKGWSMAETRRQQGPPS